VEGGAVGGGKRLVAARRERERRALVSRVMDLLTRIETIWRQRHLYCSSICSFVRVMLF
jgi:hypothetical protein